MLNIVDAIIILIILLGGVVGFKRGFTKQLVRAVGFILVVVLAFKFKNSVSIFLYQNLPFFNFGGVFAGVSVLNILIYELIAFLAVLAILIVALRMILIVTGLFETILNFTIVLGFISKILGAIVGVIEYFVIVFIGLYILSLPFFNIGIIKESKYEDSILNNTPILSRYIGKSMDVIDEFVELKDKYNDKNTPNEFNNEALDLMLKYKIISVNSAERLIEKKKLSDGAYEILNKYKYQ